MGSATGVLALLFVHLCRPSAALVSRPIAEEKRLIDDLLDGYNPSARPRVHANESIHVYIGYELHTLISMNEKLQTMSIVGWFYMTWKDDILVWDPAMYNSIASILLPQGKIWSPDAWFLNGVDKLFYDADRMLALVDYNGSVLFQPGGPIVLSCDVNLVFFPFDEQTCTLIILAWSNTEDKMMLHVDRIYTSNPVENDEWKLVATTASRRSIPYPGGNYSELTFKLLLQRKPPFQVVNVVVPIVTLPLLNLAVFHLPPESGEKVSLSITVLLAFSVWLLMMSSITPSSSDNMPIVAICTVIFMVLSTITVLITVAVVHLYHTDDSRIIPSWVRRVLQWHRRRHVKRSQEYPVDDESQSRCSEKVTWKDVAAAVDGIMYYTFLAIIITVIGAAAAAILIGAPQQSSAFKQQPPQQ